MAYLAAILALIVALGGGYWWVDSTAFDRGYADRDGKCTTEKLEIENAKLEAERQAKAEREKGRILADRAAEQVATLKASLAANSERFNRELNKHASSTRLCFSPPVARLLDRPSMPSGDPGPASPPATGAPPDTSASASPAEGSEAGTSERAAASYIDLIRDRFEACRAQLRAVLIGTNNEPID